MRSFAAAMLWLLAAAVQAQPAVPVPPHLVLARELVQNVKPEDNRCELGGQASRGYAARADCNGPLLALFQRAIRCASRWSSWKMGRPVASS